MDGGRTQGEWGQYSRWEDLPDLQREHYEVARSFGDRWMSTAEFKEEYRRRYPERPAGSMLPSDHVVGHYPQGRGSPAKFLERQQVSGRRYRYRFVGLSPTAGPSPVRAPFVVGAQYSRIDVQERLGLPEPTTTGRWSTGYTREAGVFFVFANVGVPGQTGHDYPNQWLPDGRLAWEAQGRTRRGQPEIEALLAPGAQVHVFWRDKARAPFEYAGQARAEDVENSSPVRLKWAFEAKIDHPAPAGRYFGLLCDPEIYDIESVLSVLTADTWVLPKGDVEPGDRFILWKTKGKGPSRGIAGLAEATSVASEMNASEASRPFWVDEPMARQRRFCLRYVVPPNAPLWIDEDASGVLAELTVARTRGGKRLYKITDEQWAAVLELLGGWPEAEDPQGTERSAPSTHRRPFRRAPRPNPKTQEHVQTIMRRDPSLLDRALDAHADIQEALAEQVRAAGFEPWYDREPPVDLGWVDGEGVLNVVEAKSITDVNEVSQLRLGLGQVLHYAALLRAQEPGRQVRPMLAVEKAPSDARIWSMACEAAGVLLTWGPSFGGAVQSPG